MKKPKKEGKIPVVVKNESIKEFFKRGRDVAKLIDQKNHIVPARIISFEDVHDLVKFLTETKLNLISAVRKKAISISDLSKTLNRSRSAVGKDIQLLESVGILKSKYITNSGHGRLRIITTFDKSPIKFTVETTI